MWNTRRVWLAALVCLGLGCSSWLRADAHSPADARAMANVAAFARLYGVIRYFYPSDAAATINWDRFAIEGVARVRTASDSSVLASRLRELVAPLGPGIEIGATLSPFRAPAATTEPLVAWRYLGPGLSDPTANTRTPYAARRTNRGGPELFSETPPTVSDHADVDLGDGLKARVTLTLTDSQAKAATASAGAAPATTDLDARLADIMIAWNVYRHFYPYFTDASVDWDARLQPQLQAAYDATTRTAEWVALRQLVADARDGHGGVTDLRQPARLTMPLRFRSIDSHIIVTASGSADVPVGSLVSSIDGVNAMERFATAAQLSSGTTQWRNARAAGELAWCTSGGATAHVAIETGGATHTVDVPCASGTVAPLETRPAQVTELKPGVWYVDLTRAKKADLIDTLGKLASASAVIFDVRGYPTDSGAWILPYLVDAPEQDRWMHVAKIAGPFGQVAGWEHFGWNLQPAAPRLTGKRIVLTDGRAISYAESVMGYMADRHLATIVGAPTAGTNGNVVTFTMPGEFRISLTGMRVTGHDGHAIHHLVGIQPDIVVSPTLAGLRAGKDEVLDRALSLIR